MRLREAKWTQIFRGNSLVVLPSLILVKALLALYFPVRRLMVCHPGRAVHSLVSRGPAAHAFT
jgi:hypothetical protein